jgi:hypothetical protein
LPTVPKKIEDLLNPEPLPTSEQYVEKILRLLSRAKEKGEALSLNDLVGTLVTGEKKVARAEEHVHLIQGALRCLVQDGKAMTKPEAKTVNPEDYYWIP